MQSRENTGIHIEGHLKIWDPTSNEIFVNKRNAIHYENFSISLASGIANIGQQYINSMSFGNGGTLVDPTGIITYLTPNTTGSNASLYNQTYDKVVDNRAANNTDSTRNYMTILHTTGNNYTDILVTCLLDYGEPSNQSAYDTTPNGGQEYVFDELGLKSSSGLLLTHVIFHPVQKSLNRLVQIDYTVRVQTLSGG